MNPGECPENTENLIKIQNRTEKVKTEQDKIIHPVSYAAEHNSQVHSRWIEIPLIK